MQNNNFNKIKLVPILNEKSLMLVKKNNQYTFAVSGKANKIEITDEVKKRFGVNAVSVRTLNLRGKRVRSGKKRIFGIKSTRSKAIVSLEKGKTIDLFNLK